MKPASRTLRSGQLENNAMSRSEAPRKALMARLTVSVALLPLSFANAAYAAAPDARVTPKSTVVFESIATPQDRLNIRDTVLGSPPIVVTNNAQGNYGANAKVAKIEVVADKNGFAADGHSPTHIIVRLYDDTGHLLSGDAFVTVELGGTARTKFAGATTDELGGRAADEDRATPGSQIKVTNGSVEFDVIAATVPGDVDLRISAGRAQAAGKLSYLTEVRPLFALGIVEGVISKRRLNPGTISAINANDGFEQDLQNWSRQFSDGTRVAGRAAFFAKGTIAKDVSITAAYDSDKDLRTRLMRDISPDLYYPVTGDASITGFDARTSGRGYLRLDRGRSYALYGDFNTGDGFSQLTGGGSVAGINVRKLGAYNRTVTGLRLHNENGRYAANAFAMYDRLRQSVEQYPLNGTSILPFADARNAIVGSEKVEIVTYDKNLRTQIVGITPLIRYQDYAFEPFNGRIRLLGGDVNFIDADGNPRFIRVTYENDQDSANSTLTYGGDAQIKISSAIEVGGSFVREDNPNAPYTLYSGNATMRLGPQTVVVGEFAHSDALAFLQSNGTTSNYSTGAAGERSADLAGSAYRVELAHQSAGVTAKGFYEHVDAGFLNQSIGLSTGQTSLGAKIDVRISPALAAYGDASRIQDIVSTNHPARESEEAGLRWLATDRLTLSGALHHIHEDAGLTSQLNLPGNYGGIFNPNGLALSGANFGNPGFTNIANTTAIETITARLGLSYKLTDRLNLDGDFEHAIADADHNRYAIGASYQLAERTRVYARYEDQTGLGSGLSLNQGDRSSAFVAGFSSSYNEGSQIYSEYRLRDAGSAQSVRAQDMQLASGVRRSWRAADGVTLSSNVEYLKVFSGNARDAIGIGAGADFTGNSDWKGSVRGEARRIFDDPNAVGDQTQDQYLFSTSAAYKVSDSWTVLVRNYLVFNRYHDDATGRPTGNILQDRAQIGAAFRPVGDDRIIGLVRYDFKTYRDRATVDGVDYRAHLASVNLNWHPSRRLTVDARLAGELRTDRVPNSATGGTQSTAFNAVLASARAIYDVTDHIDLSVMAAVVRSNQADATQYAQGAEAGYLFAKNVWISAGYNWTGFDTADLSGTEYHNRGAYLRLRIKFNEMQPHF
jgi:hypothetical protein